MTIESTNKNPGSRQRRSHRKQERQAILDGTLIPAKPVITHKPRKKLYVVPTATPVVEFENIVYDNPLINEPVEIHSALSEGMWNHTPSITRKMTTPSHNNVNDVSIKSLQSNTAKKASGNDSVHAGTSNDLQSRSRTHAQST